MDDGAVKGSRDSERSHVWKSAQNGRRCLVDGCLLSGEKQTGRTGDRTRPDAVKRQKVLARTPSTRDPRR
jgi:hypothetical protein